MILRSITQHVKNQNWFAVMLDFIIVVVGVFVGLQVSNWNEAKTFDNKETELLYELKKEMENSILTTNQKIDNYDQVAAAAKRSLDFLSGNVSCETKCWSILVDFMHASQHLGVTVQRSTYVNMRRIGLPRKNLIFDAVEANLAQVDAAIQAFSEQPYYRTLVRQLISYEAQEFYWNNCWSALAGVETYDLNCPKGVPDELAFESIEVIAQNPEIKPQLTLWFSTVSVLPIALKSQNLLAEKAIAEINAELEHR